jgi:ferrochelatase
MKKTAVILFNLGGPDSLEAVAPFLFNLFNDKAIIGLPQPLRYLLAKLISRKRTPVAQEIYGHIGGKSPILELTQAQASALEQQLASASSDYKVFIAMRYWHPFTHETVHAVKSYAPDEIILLPLYPQFSSTTSGSSLKLWHQEALRAGITAPSRTICCYPMQDDLITAHCLLLEEAYGRAQAFGSPRILFSAHGLPEKIIKAGDPYQWQVEQTVSRLMQHWGKAADYVVCYQSRVGPLQWIGPSTEDEIARGGKDGVPLVIVPIAFVSEHSETLVELDIEYKARAEAQGVPAYIRVPALGSMPEFIKGLAALCLNTVETKRICPQDRTMCGCLKRA